MNRLATVRAFLAFELPEEVRAHLKSVRDEVRSVLPPARWTRPGGWHLTLKFLGETELVRLEELSTELGPRLAGHGPVKIELVGGGFFPSKKRPRVAWIGGTARGADAVAREVEAAAVQAGFAAERRPWSVHVTMARIKSQWSRDAVDTYLEWAGHSVQARCDCREVVLFASRLQPGGAVYTALERIPFE